MPDSISLRYTVSQPPAQAFALLLEAMATGLRRRGLRFQSGPEGGVWQAGQQVGAITEWRDGSGLGLRWHPASWAPELVNEIELRVDPAPAGATLALEIRGLAAALDGEDAAAAWFASEAACALLEACAPARLGDWLTDRGARRPFGEGAREIYRAPLYHYPGFQVILGELRLSPRDHLLDVGCGGGAFLQLALASGCTAEGLDHSPEMLEVARAQNAEPIRAGRLHLHEAGAEHLPLPNSRFTAAAMHGVLGFLPRPVAALAEIHRVLRPGGRLVVAGSDPELRGTPAAPEPMASRLHFYDDQDLLRLAREAGFEAVRVLRVDMTGLAQAAGIPHEHLGLYSSFRARFLAATK